jgi:hypothetical protein
MSGEVRIVVGKYDISEQVWLDIRLTDIGLAISMCDNETNTRYTVILDEGKVAHAVKAALIRGEPRKGVCGDEPRGAAEVAPVGTEREHELPQPSALLSPYEPLDLKLEVVFEDRSEPHLFMPVFGGYQNTRFGTIMILYRNPSSLRGPCDGVLELREDRKVNLRKWNPVQYLSLDDWEMFFELRVGDTFKQAGHAWRKLGRAELRKLIHRRRFRYTAE